MPERTGRDVGGACIELETLSAYVDGMLDARERADVEAHLAVCPDCYELMSEVLHIQEAVSAARLEEEPARGDVPVPPPAPRPAGGTVIRGVFGRRKFVWGGAAVALTAAAAALFLVVRTPPAWWTGGVDPKLADLVEAVGEERTVEARLTGGFKYGPLRSPTRSGGRVGPTDNWKLLAAAGRIREEAEKDPTPENLHVSGVASLVVGELDDAVRLLEEANANESTDARVQNDLAAAYLARGQAQNQPADFATALSLVEQALRKDRLSPDAQFNRALALEAIGLRGEARTAWEAFLAVDPSSRWADEARAHLERFNNDSGHKPWSDFVAELSQSGYPADVVRRAVEFNAQAAREHAEDDLLPAWADADGKQQATWIDSAEAIAREHQHTTEDELLPQAVARIRHAYAVDDRQLLDNLRRGHHLWRRGKQAYAQDQMTAMAARFTEAAAAFKAAESPYELWALHFQVVGLYYGGHIQQAYELVQQLLPRADAARYSALQARLRWDRGTLLFQQALFEAAAADYEEGIRRFEHVAEPENAAALHQLLAESFARLGERERSWRHHLISLRAWPRMRDQRRKHTLVMGAGLSALAHRLPGTAFNMFTAGVANAQAWRAPAAIAESNINLARATYALGDIDGARGALEQARAQIDAIADAGLATKNRADLFEAQAEIERVREPETAIRAATSALAQYASIASEYRLASLHLLLGTSHAKTGDVTTAKEVLERGIALLESKRAVIRQRELRISYLDSAWDLYGERARLAFEGGEYDDALRFAEKARARVLLETVADGAAPAVADPAALRLTLPSDVALVYYCALSDRTLAWVVAREGVTATAIDVSRAWLEHQIHQYLMFLANQSPRAELAGRSLHSLLLEPIGHAIAGKRRLLFVADATLQAVPFAALTNARTGRRVLDETSTVLLPSATSARLLAPHLPQLRPERVTLLRGPDVDAAGSLRPLPGAGAEVERIAMLYSQREVIGPRDVTAKEFERALVDSDVVHFAGHAVTDAETHDEPALLLSAGRVKLSSSATPTKMLRCGLVVLSACRTGAGRASRGEGLMNLARPLLMRGVPNVLVSLWDVPDDSTRVFQEEFHRQLLRSGDAAEALQRAQLVVSERDPADKTWAGFVLVGTDASLTVDRSAS